MYRHNTELPPRIGVSPTKRRSKNYKKKMLDALERIGYEQYVDNLERFQDYYDMYDGNLSKRELREMVHMPDDFFSQLEEADIPTWIRHYDFIGALIKALVGKFIDMKQKFNVIEEGDEIQNDFLEFKKTEIEGIASEIIDNAVRIGMARRGINVDEGRQFNSPEEQQAYQAELEQMKQSLTPKIVSTVQKFPNFKSLGVQWGENILDRDREKLEEQYKEMFKHWLLTGVCAKITKVHYDTIKTYIWDSREVFHSKDMGEKLLNRYEYVGRFHHKTPSQVVEEYGHKMTEEDKIKILSEGGAYSELFTGEFSDLKYSPKHSMEKFFHEKYWVNTPDYFSRRSASKMEQYTGIPMGVVYSAGENGWESRPTFMNTGGFNRHSHYGASMIEGRFSIRQDLCQVTEVYVKVFERVGWLTYEDELGTPTTTMVTEDILKDFLRENNIKQTLKVTFEEIMKGEQELNTLVWQSMPVYYEGVKVQGGYLEEPVYICFEKLDYQITDISTFDVKCPVSGLVTNSVAQKLAPYQEGFNLMMNQIRHISETEVGTFFVTDIMNIASEYSANGEDTEGALINMRNVAKRTKLLPIATNPENIAGGASPFNQFQAHNLSDIQGVQWRLQVADRYKMEGYSQIGLNPQQALMPTKYTNEEGIKMSNDSMNDQLADIFDAFNQFIKEDQIQHLNINHWMQSFNMDKTIFYTNGYNHNIFLDVSKDDRFSFRRIGLNISDDSRKKKDFETIKQYLLSQNTMGGDSLSFAKLVFSDTATQLVQIAQEERAIAQQQAQLDHERQMEQLQFQAEQQQALEQANWEREEVTNERNRANRLEERKIDALGRATDNNADATSLQWLKTQADIAIAGAKESNRAAEKQAELELKKQELSNKKDELGNKFSFEREKLEAQQRMKEIDREIAIINPG